MLGVGIVGAGRMGRRHAEAIARTEGLQLMRVTDVVPEAASALAARTNSMAATDLKEILDDPAIDVIAVCSPTTAHARQVREALDAGKHVLCEKPLAARADEVNALVDLAEAQDRVLVVGYLYRFAPAFMRMRELLRSEALGSPHLAIFRIGGRGGHQLWKHTTSAAGGALFDMMSHMIDLGCWLLGPAQSVRLLSEATLLPERSIGGRTHRVDAEDYLVTEWRSQTGALCLCEGDLVSPSFMQYVEIHGRNGSIFGSIVDDLPTTLFLREAASGFEAGTHLLVERTSQPIDLEWASLRDRVIGGARDDDETIRATASALEALRIAGVEARND